MTLGNRRLGETPRGGEAGDASLDHTEVLLQLRTELEEMLDRLSEVHTETIGSRKFWFIGADGYHSAYERVRRSKGVWRSLMATLREYRADTHPGTDERGEAVRLLEEAAQLRLAAAALEEHCWKMWRKIRFVEPYPRAEIERDMLAADSALREVRRLRG